MKKIIIISVLCTFLLSSCMKETEEIKPIRKDVIETVFGSGILEADGTYFLTALTDGYIVSLNFQENSIVKPDQVLAVIDNKQNLLNTESSNALFDIAQSNTAPNSPLLAQAMNNLEVARHKMGIDSLQMIRDKQLLAAKAISNSEYENTEFQYNTSKTNYHNALENYRIQKQQAYQQLVISKTQSKINAVLSGYNQLKAYFAGRVYQRYKQKGDYVRKGEAIAMLGNSNVLYAKVSIDESSINKVRVGQDAVIQLNINKQKTYKGRVSEILPSFNEQTQSFICKIHFSDSLDFKVPNTQLQANIITGTNKNALLIPRRFLSYGNFVNVKGSKSPVKVKTRFISSQWVQIESGIDEKTVIVNNNVINK